MKISWIFHRHTHGQTTGYEKCTKKSNSTKMFEQIVLFKEKMKVYQVKISQTKQN